MSLSIGLARKAGVELDTVRDYRGNGLLGPAGRLRATGTEIAALATRLSSRSVVADASG